MRGNSARVVWQASVYPYSPGESVCYCRLTNRCFETPPRHSLYPPRLFVRAAPALAGELSRAPSTFLLPAAGDIAYAGVPTPSTHFIRRGLPQYLRAFPQFRHPAFRVRVVSGRTEPAWRPCASRRSFAEGTVSELYKRAFVIRVGNVVPHTLPLVASRR